MDELRMGPDNVHQSPSYDSIPFGVRMKLFLKVYWKSLVVVLTPILLMPLPIIKNTPDYRCMFVVLLMSVYWVTEALPLQVTAMIPVVLFPTMGILDAEPTCQSYMKGSNMMFIGGLMFAAGLQDSKIHKRIALKTIQIIGCSHRRLIFALSLVTTFLTMWVSNSATVTMMVPITEAVLEVLEQQGLGDMYIRKAKDSEENAQSKPQKPTKITKCYFISIAYSATIGAIGSLIGTGTNITFKDAFESSLPNAPQVDFLYWMLYNVPTVIVMELFTYVWLQVLFMGMFRPNSEDAKQANLGKDGTELAKQVIDTHYKDLGPMTWHEKSAAMLFIVAVLMYFLRSPRFITGWADIMTNTTKVNDAVTSMFIVIMMFVLLSTLDFLKFFRKRPQNDLATNSGPGIVTWAVFKDKVPWGLMFLLGGGFALSEGVKKSGMSVLISEPLTRLNVLPPPVILLIVVLLCELLTEFTSNVAIANILLPVLMELAVAIRIHPMYLLLPATVACTMAFHLPVSTPPNAIVAGVANINTGTMVIAGIGPKIVTIIVIWASFLTWGTIIYPDVTSFPEWAEP